MYIPGIKHIVAVRIFYRLSLKSVSSRVNMIQGVRAINAIDNIRGPKVDYAGLSHTRTRKEENPTAGMGANATRPTVLAVVQQILPPTVPIKNHIVKRRS